MEIEKQLEKKVQQGFVTCFHDDCPQHEHCLRWLGRGYADTTPLVMTCVSMVNPDIGGEACPMYRPDRKVRFAYGFIGLLEQLPKKMGNDLMDRLIGECKRTYAYEHRNGKRPIPPQLQQKIISYLRNQGWEQPVDFDRYSEDYLW